jgi:hypothetical protein
MVRAHAGIIGRCLRMVQIAKNCPEEISCWGVMIDDQYALTWYVGSAFCGNVIVNVEPFPT